VVKMVSMSVESCAGPAVPNPWMTSFVPAIRRTT
jgi:hypothetical protein